MREITRIIYASDFSPASLVAFPHALRLAKAVGAELTILTVLPSPVALFIDGGYVPQNVWDELYRGARAQADKEMDALLREAVTAGVPTSASIVEGTSPADDIVHAARSLKADLLVLGTHGRTGVARFFLGSVAARVVATAACPVLTVRAETGAEQP
jgi:nucleotide-binding universal stress UspA family protein